jgi:hypothetical protein
MPDVTKQLELETLAQLIYAQKFTMPAGTLRIRKRVMVQKVGDNPNV